MSLVVVIIHKYWLNVSCSGYVFATQYTYVYNTIYVLYLTYSLSESWPSGEGNRLTLGRDD